MDKKISFVLKREDKVWQYSQPFVKVVSSSRFTATNKLENYNCDRDKSCIFFIYLFIWSNAGDSSVVLQKIK